MEYIAELPLANRTKRALHRMGVHTIEMLLSTPRDDILRQKGVGQKAINELDECLQLIYEGQISVHCDLPLDEMISDKDCDHTSTYCLTEEEMQALSLYDISELCLSTRPYNALYREGWTTMDQLVLLKYSDLQLLYGLGQKSCHEILSAVEKWFAQWRVSFKKSQMDIQDLTEEEQVRIHEVYACIAPTLSISERNVAQWFYVQDENISTEAFQWDDLNERIKHLLKMPECQLFIQTFWMNIMEHGIIDRQQAHKHLKEVFPNISEMVVVDSSLELEIICQYQDYYFLKKKTLIEVFSEFYQENNRNANIMKLKLQGYTLQEIGDYIGITRERVRQITLKEIRKFPRVYEDYYAMPYMFFHFMKDDFLRIFPELTEESYEFLSIKYRRGKEELNLLSLSYYDGPWKNRLISFLQKEQTAHYWRTVSRREMIYQVLMTYSDKSLSIEEFEQVYYDYIRFHSGENQAVLKRLTINIRTVLNHFREAPGILFNKENKFRYWGGDPKVLWEHIDFCSFENLVISSHLIYRDYPEVMEEMELQDGHEVFYLIKKTMAYWQGDFDIHCRRVPTLVMGEASEDIQAIQFLKKVAPIDIRLYYHLYEKRFGILSETAASNPIIYNVLASYAIDGVYHIDVPEIDSRDIEAFMSSLAEKSLWFVDELEHLFEKICIHSSIDAINKASFQRIGYILNTGYAFPLEYRNISSYLSERIFSEDIIDLTTIDRRIKQMSVFGSMLYQKRLNLEYIEVEPKVLVATDKLDILYGITIEEIKQLQQILRPYLSHQPFFNAHSLWPEIKSLPMVAKWEQYEWFLTSIIRQQDDIYALRLSDGIILSSDSQQLSLVHICTWIGSVFGPMSLYDLQNKFKEIFGVAVPSWKLAEKLKSKGRWEQVINEPLEEYIASLLSFYADDEFNEISLSLE